MKHIKKHNNNNNNHTRKGEEKQTSKIPCANARTFEFLFSLIFCFLNKYMSLS